MDPRSAPPLRYGFAQDDEGEEERGDDAARRSVLPHVPIRFVIPERRPSAAQDGVSGDCVGFQAPYSGSKSLSFFTSAFAVVTRSLAMAMMATFAGFPASRMARYFARYGEDLARHAASAAM